MAGSQLADAHRHPGVLPAWPFYGGPPVNPDIGAVGPDERLRAAIFTSPRPVCD